MRYKLTDEIRQSIEPIMWGKRALKNLDGEYIDLCVDCYFDAGFDDEHGDHPDLITGEAIYNPRNDHCAVCGKPLFEIDNSD